MGSAFRRTNPAKAGPTDVRRTMVRLALAFVTGLTLFAVAGLQQPAGTLHTGKAFRFNQGEGGRLPRRRNRHALGGGERRHHRQRQRRHRRRRSRIARRSLGLARGVEGHHQQAGKHRHQYPLSLRSCAWQPGLRKRGRHHRPRVHPRDAARRQVARDASVQELRRGASTTDRGSAEAGRGRARSPRGRRHCRRSFKPPKTTRLHKRN